MGETPAVTNQALFDRSARGVGMVVNSSRAILYAGKEEDFADRARAMAQATRDEINRYRLR